MRKSGCFLLHALILNVLLVAGAAAQVPFAGLRLQGSLSDMEGTPVDGTFSVTVRIYDVPEGGTPLWSETQDVEFTAGLFDVELGSSEPLPDSVFNAERYWSMEIGGEELSPRNRITPGAFAVRARFVDQLSAENIMQFWQAAQSTPDFDGDGHEKISTGGDDCDDLDPSVYPGADEFCDGKDNDCNGYIDDNTVDCPEGLICSHLQCVPADVDGDGYGNDVDCDDNDPNIHPGAPELCNGVDDDCNGTVDDNVTDCPSGSNCVNGACIYQDNDGDGYTSDVDCDDNDPNVHPGAPEECDGIDNDCDGFVDNWDDDGDGYSRCFDDCDDTDPNVYPGAPEVCGNGYDDNCNGQVDEGCPTDNDGDGYYSDVDCDDNNPDVHPGAQEYCNGIDDDCDGTVDEDCLSDSDGDGYYSDVDCDDNNPNVHPDAQEICNGIDDDCNGLVDDVDSDNDGYYACFDDCDDNDPNVHPGAVEICNNGIDDNCDGTIDEGCLTDNDGDGYYSDVDCDDNNPNVHPGAPELCNGIDDDCNGFVDDVDNDNDGFICAVDCDDNDPNVHPGAQELCDGIDNDCNGIVDDADNDGDGYYACVDDCDDGDPAIYPGAPELCDGFDNDCDGIVDNNLVDFDGDGYACDVDCDDSDPNVHPGATEICGNGIDDNCDGQVDEGCP